MARDTATAAAKNKRIRQEALRAQLASQKHVEHVVDILGKLKDESNEVEPQMVQRYKIVLDAKFKLIDKYLPTEKPTDLSVSDADGNPLNFSFSMVLKDD